MNEALAVKMIYTWPGDFHFRFGFSDKVLHFTQETLWTVLCSWEDAYALIRDERSGQYLRMEWDPKAIAKSVYASPGVRQMNGANNISSEQEVVKISDGKEELEATLPESGEVTPEDTAALDDLLGKMTWSNNESGAKPTGEVVLPGAEESLAPDLKENMPSSSANFSNTIVAEVADNTEVESSLSK